MGLVNANIERMAGYTPGEQPEKLSVIKLNTNENPYPPSPRVLTAIASVTAERLRRYPSPDARAFRMVAAKVHGVDPDWIMATNGGDELLSIVFRACLAPGDRVAFLDPGYSLYPVLATLQNAQAVTLNYQVRDTDWNLPPEIFTVDARLLLLVNPNAPSGTLIGMSTLVQILRSFRGVVLVDEAYVDFAPASALPLVKSFENLVILRSMSKGYGLAGLRFGYAIAQKPLLIELNKVRDSYPCDIVAITAASAALEDQEYARSIWGRVIEHRTQLTEALVAMGFSVPPSFSNFVLAAVPAGASAAQLYARLKARDILVRYFALPGLEDKLRITVGTRAENQSLIRAIGEILSADSKNLHGVT